MDKLFYICYCRFVHKQISPLTTILKFLLWVSATVWAAFVCYSAVGAQDEQPTPTPGITPVVVILAATPEPPLSLAEPAQFESKVVPGASLPDLLIQIDADIAAIWPTVISRQAAYLKMAGDYYQGLALQDDPPEDGKTEYPDNWFDHPTDQGYSWNNIKIFPYRAMAYNVVIDVYEGTLGKGFVVRFVVVVDGVTYERDFNEGGEVWRDQYWFIPETEASQG